MKQEKKLTFLKKLKISITDFEKYQDLGAEKIPKTIIYILILMLVFSLVIAAVVTYKFSINSDEISQFISANIDTESVDSNLLNYVQNYEKTLSNLYNQIGIVPFFGVIWLYMFIIYFTSTLLDILVLSLFGMIIASLTKMKIKYYALFNISAYSFTLPIILNLIYFVINSFTGFSIRYFEVMYTTVASIYVVAAILLIRDDIIKKQIQLTRIIQEQEKVRAEMQRHEEEKRQEEEKEKVRKKDREREDEENGSGEGLEQS